LVSSRVAAVTSATALLILLATAAPAGAIFNGSPDSHDHPNVAAVLAAEAFSDGTWTECTGVLISPTVLVSAAHCHFENGESVAVTFDEEYDSSTGTTYSGTWHRDPRFKPYVNQIRPMSNPYDLAVIVFPDPIPGITPAQLPEAGSLANLPRGTQFTAVGYGAQFVTHKKGGQLFHYTDTRYAAAGGLRTQNRALLRISMNPAFGEGGACTGDSGGPEFLGAGSDETAIVAATTSTGDFACQSTNVAYRLDTASARSFLGQYVTLP
jgi:hypothetical protein